MLVYQCKVRLDYCLTPYQRRKLCNDDGPLREKGSDLTQLHDKRPKTMQIKITYTDATKTFDFTMITDRVRTVSWRDNSHATGVVNVGFKGSTFPLPTTDVQSKGHTFKKNYK